MILKFLPPPSYLTYFYQVRIYKFRAYSIALPSKRLTYPISSPVHNAAGQFHELSKLLSCCCSNYVFLVTWE